MYQESVLTCWKWYHRVMTIVYSAGTKDNIHVCTHARVCVCVCVCVCLCVCVWERERDKDNMISKHVETSLTAIPKLVPFVKFDQSCAYIHSLSLTCMQTSLVGDVWFSAGAFADHIQAVCCCHQLWNHVMLSWLKFRHLHHFYFFCQDFSVFFQPFYPFREGGSRFARSMQRTTLHWHWF